MVMRELPVNDCSEKETEARESAVCEQMCEPLPEKVSGAPPIGEVGHQSDRDQAGRFRAGNRASLVVGARSAQFWAAHAAERTAIVEGIVADAGHVIEDAPRALLAAAEGIAQALLLRDSAFERLVESGGPLTASGRTRRAFTIWAATLDRVERHLRLVGLRRVPRPGPSLEEFLARRAADASQANENPEAGR